MIPRILLTIALAAGAAMAQYKMEPAGPPPPELAPAFAQALQKDGARILNASGSVICEVWLRSTAPSGPPSTEANVTLPTIPHGAFLGVIRYPARYNDRRGLTIQPGIYTLRYSLYPTNGEHVGISPQRDFAILVRAADDTDVNATPNFDDLMAMSRKASGSPHPATLSIWKSALDKFPAFEKEGDKDWVLNAKMGDVPLAIILIGKFEG